MTSHENDNIELVCRLKAKMFEMSNSEFVSAICRRNAVEDATVGLVLKLLIRLVIICPAQ